MVILIKSIQMHDDDMKEAICPARVGLSLKGIKPDEIQRGDILTSDDSLEVKTELLIDLISHHTIKEKFLIIKCALSILGFK